MESIFAERTSFIGTFVLEFTGSAIATLFASAGAEFIIVDMEHSAFSIETVAKMIRNARGSNLPCIVRGACTGTLFYLQSP